MKRNCLILLLFAWITHAMEIIEPRPDNLCKRKRDESQEQRHALRLQKTKQQKISREKALAKKALVKEQLFKLWISKKQPHYWQKVKEHTERGTLSDYGLFYLFTYMPHDMKVTITNELIGEINPYYVARILDIYPTPTLECSPIKPPALKVKPSMRVPKERLIFIESYNAHNSLTHEYFPPDVTTYIFAHKLTSCTYHQWEFIKKIGQKYKYGFPTFFVQDHEGTLTFGFKKSLYLYRIFTGEYFDEKRRVLYGKLTLEELLLLKLGQQIAAQVPENRRKQLEDVKTKFKTIFKKEKEEYDQANQ